MGCSQSKASDPQLPTVFEEQVQFAIGTPGSQEEQPGAAPRQIPTEGGEQEKAEKAEKFVPKVGSSSGVNQLTRFRTEPSGLSDHTAAAAGRTASERRKSAPLAHGSKVRAMTDAGRGMARLGGGSKMARRRTVGGTGSQHASATEIDEIDQLSRLERFEEFTKAEEQPARSKPPWYVLEPVTVWNRLSSSKPVTVVCVGACNRAE